MCKTLSPFSDSERSRSGVLLLPPEELPGLNYPELWTYNPLTSTETLTHMALEQIRSVDMIDRVFWQKWQQHAHRGLRILGDKGQLQLLTDEARQMGREDWRQLEQAAGLDALWTTADFLGLFIHDPFEEMSMLGPNIQSYDGQPNYGTTALQHLVQWAKLTKSLLDKLRTSRTKLYCLKIPDLSHYYDESMRVANFHCQVAGSGKSNNFANPSIHLRKILHQNFEATNPEVQKGSRKRFLGECYWDWSKFMSDMQKQQDVSYVVRTDIAKVQAALEGIKPDLEHKMKSRQVLAAHGIDPETLALTEIQIR